MPMIHWLNNRHPRLLAYADGRPYAAPRSLAAREPDRFLRASLRPVLDLRRSQLPWTLFWQVIQRELRGARFRTSTLRLYRQVLRRFKGFCERPRAVATPPGGQPAPSLY